MFLRTLPTTTFINFHPKSAYGLRLKKNQLLHPFQSHDKRFRVLNMGWDKSLAQRGRFQRFGDRHQ